MLKNLIVILFAMVGCLQQVYGEALCRPYQIVEEQLDGPQKFSEGLLWKISRNGIESGYIFGTIHIDDSDVLDLPDAVIESVTSSKKFIMEVVPEPEDALEMSITMFFMDGTRLDDILNSEIFDKTTNILASYGFTEEMVTVLKPWAAFIVMSYPQTTGEILDFKLLELARNSGVDIHGLETASEQLAIFSNLSLDNQARLLTDTVCHYDSTKSDFEVIKRYYLDRDLAGLFSFSKRYSFGDDSVYEQIASRLITQRNIRMTEKIIDFFNGGKAFIAVGAMHLPGEEGILNLLQLRNFHVEQIY